jgi:hypothetical protein
MEFVWRGGEELLTTQGLVEEDGLQKRDEEASEGVL